MSLMNFIWLEYVGCYKAEDESTKWERDGDQAQLTKADLQVNSWCIWSLLRHDTIHICQVSNLSIFF